MASTSPFTRMGDIGEPFVPGPWLGIAEHDVAAGKNDSLTVRQASRSRSPRQYPSAGVGMNLEHRFRLGPFNQLH
jgi:hypothetical protein